jgi:hypothetical protein
MDQVAPSTFEYFGDYRPYQNIEELPCHSGLLFSGWVHHASSDQAELSSRVWRVQLGDLDAEIFCEPAVGTFLSHCLMDGLDCWATGYLLLPPTTSFCPLVFGVYSLRRRAQQLSEKVAQCLAASAVQTAIRDVFENPAPCRIPGTSTGPSLCHPVAYLLLMQKVARLQLAPEALRAVFFIVHSEASTLARTSIFYGQDATRLGTSSFTYRGGKGHGAVQRAVPPNAFPGEVIRGCAVVAQRSACPLIKTSPCAGSTKRSIRLNIVDLPPPDGPTSAVIFCAGKLWVTSFSTVFLPYLKLTPLNSMVARPSGISRAPSGSVRVSGASSN